MSGRVPNALDVERMQEAVAIVTAYDIGVEEGDFGVYKEMTGDVDSHEGMVHALAQLSWLLLKAMDNSGIPKERVMDWYGSKFAVKAEEMRE